MIVMQKSPGARCRTAILLVAAFAIAACGRSAEQQAAAPPTSVAYTGATVIVGDGSEPIVGAVIVVDAGRIVSVGPLASTTLPEGMTQVDLSGKTVMPALVDSHVHLSTTRDALVTDLRRRAYFGIAGAVSFGSDGPGTPLEMRGETLPGAARYKSAGHGITSPEPGRNQVHWVKTEEEARQAVRTEVARKVDLIKMWVDDRNGQYQKLSPALYGAVIDEAHRANLKVAAHIFALDDAKGLLRAGVDIFAHGVRDRDIDDEFVALVKERPNVVLIPNLPGRGVAADMSWLGGALAAEEVAKLQTRRSRQSAAAGHLRYSGSQSRAPRERRYDHRHGHGRQHALGAACRDGRHGRCGNDAGSGHCRRHPQFRTGIRLARSGHAGAGSER